MTAQATTIYKMFGHDVMPAIKADSVEKAIRFALRGAKVVSVRETEPSRTNMYDFVHAATYEIELSNGVTVRVSDDWCSDNNGAECPRLHVSLVSHAAGIVVADRYESRVEWLAPADCRVRLDDLGVTASRLLERAVAAAV